jgi:hypothetical protein
MPDLGKISERAMKVEAEGGLSGQEVGELIMVVSLKGANMPKLY